MFSPLKMSKISVLVLGRHLHSVTNALGDSGLVHLVDATSDVSGQMLSGLSLENNVRELEQLDERLSILLDNMGVDLDYEVPEIGELSKEDIVALLDKVEDLYNKQSANIAELVQKKSTLVNSELSMSQYPFRSLRLDSLQNLSHLYVAVGTMSEESFLRARQFLSEDAIFVSNKETPRKVLVISNRKKRFAIDDSLAKFGFERIEVPSQVHGSIDEARSHVHDEVEELRRELENARLHGLELGDIYGGPLLAARKQLRNLLFLGRGQKFFGKSRQIYRITGWVPTDKVDELQEVVSYATDNTGVVEVVAAEDAAEGADVGEIPVQLGNGALSRSFRMLVTNFGTPNYHELDPSIFTGFTFVVMFGYMFGDIGQGAVLALIGLLMKLNQKLAEKMRDIGMLVALCGASAVGFGFCYGSFFGYEIEKTFHIGGLEFELPLWLSPLNEMTMPQLLLTSVAMGIVFLSVALLINVINHFRNRRYFQGVFDKYGLLGILFYWSCLGVGLWTVLGHPLAWWEITLILLPLAVLCIKEPLHNIIHYHKLTGKEGSLLDMALECAVETMETLTGYMSGTLSFIRVGAFAVSHAALCMAVFSIVKIVSGVSGGTIYSLIVIVLGNILVICFEGIVAAIQCVRLEYYEMYSRYFQGGGLEYAPYKKTDS